MLSDRRLFRVHFCSDIYVVIHGMIILCIFRRTETPCRSSGCSAPRNCSALHPQETIRVRSALLQKRSWNPRVLDRNYYVFLDALT